MAEALKTNGEAAPYSRQRGKCLGETNRVNIKAGSKESIKTHSKQALGKNSSTEHSYKTVKTLKTRTRNHQCGRLQNVKVGSKNGPWGGLQIYESNTWGAGERWTMEWPGIGTVGPKRDEERTGSPRGRG